MGLLRDAAYGIAALVTAPWWGLSMLRTGKWRTDWAARFGRVDAAQQSGQLPGRLPGQLPGPGAGPTVLVHGVSVGEINAARRMIELLDERLTQRGGGRIVVSATTNTGIERARQLYEPRYAVVRYPLDFSFSVRRFLDAVRPDAAVLIELEVWPTMVEQCAKRGAAVIVVNGRLSARSFARYRRIRPLVKSCFTKLSHAAVQTADYAQRFEAMGTPRDRISITDTMKWDNAQIAAPDEVEGAAALAAAMGLDRERPIIVAGSTGPGEEKLLVEQLASIPEAQIVIAPRKPERFEQAAEVMRSAAKDGQLIRRSQHHDGAARTPDDSRLFLLDTMGELRKAYALADAAIVGRSFIDLYGSDPLEPIALGVPTVIGPRYGDFQEMVDALREAGGIEVTSAPGETVQRLLNDVSSAKAMAQRGRDVIRKHQGATEKHVAIILEHLDASKLKQSRIQGQRGNGV